MGYNGICRRHTCLARSCRSRRGTLLRPAAAGRSRHRRARARSGTSRQHSAQHASRSSGSQARRSRMLRPRNTAHRRTAWSGGCRSRARCNCAGSCPLQALRTARLPSHQRSSTARLGKSHAQSSCRGIAGAAQGPPARGLRPPKQGRWISEACHSSRRRASSGRLSGSPAGGSHKLNAFGSFGVRSFGADIGCAGPFGCVAEGFAFASKWRAALTEWLAVRYCPTKVTE